MRRVDVCGRGDRAVLANALAEGTLDIAVVDGDGRVVSMGSVPASGERLTLSFDGGAQVSVVGRASNGAVVAEGEGPVTDSDAACVCLALTGQTGACAGLGCRVANETCVFFDLQSGDLAGVRELALPAVATTLAALEPDLVLGEEPVIRAAADTHTALLRFDLTVLPSTAVVDDAWLEVTVLPPPDQTFGVPIAVYPVLEDWDEATATWNERAAGQAWASAGVGPPSRGEQPWAMFDPDRAAQTHRIPLGLMPGAWVRAPLANFGVALVAGGGLTSFWSEEATGAVVPPQLIVRYHMADDDLPAPADAPICGNGVVEEGEACDDGDTDDADACTNACEMARCGDGIVRTGVEDCDDGNAVNDDGCTIRCLRCADPSAAAVYVGDDGRCYARYDTRRSFFVAENRCDGYGHGVLASFETRAEQTEVLAELGIPEAVLIGLTDRSSEGTFVWSTGATLDYDAFADGEPGNAGGAKDCVVLVDGRWQTRSCGESNRYICEQEGWAVDERGRAYLPVNGPTLDWDGAQLECVALSAHLAAPTSEDENAFVAALTAFPVWIGLSEGAVPDSLAWVTGERFEFTAFGSPPGLDNDEYCGELSPAGTWAVRPCAARRRFVCEQE